VKVRFEGSAAAVDPGSGTVAEVLDHFPRGRLAPSRFRVAEVTPATDGTGSDMYVNDIGMWSRVPLVGVRRRVTAVNGDITETVWMPDSRHLLFVMVSGGMEQVFIVDTDGRAAGREEVRDAGPGDGRPPATLMMLSDGERPSRSPWALPDGRVAWVVERTRQGKDWKGDLVVTEAPCVHIGSLPGGVSLPLPAPMPRTRPVLKGEEIWAYAFSADGRRVAWSTVGAIHAMRIDRTCVGEDPDETSVEAGGVLTVHYADIHGELANHLANHLAFSPDGDFIAAVLSFAGGRAVSFDAPEGAEMRMFADDKVFFIPIENRRPGPGAAGEADRWVERGSTDWVRAMVWPAADDGPGVCWR
jgi:hypothetical protein